MLEALVPIVVIAARQTQMISASITAYSTAVGPSSEAKNRRNLVANDFISSPLFRSPVGFGMKHWLSLFHFPERDSVPQM